MSSQGGFFAPFSALAEGERTLEGPGPPHQPGQTHPGPSEPAGAPEDGPRLRAVFEALDSDGDGFVHIEDFVQFATVYGAEQVKDLTKYLDPGGLGVISFEDFYRGIMAIRNGDSEGPLYGVAPVQDEESLVCPDEFDDFVTYEEGVRFTETPKQEILALGLRELQCCCLASQRMPARDQVHTPSGDHRAHAGTEVTDSAYMGSESTYSECETFTDEDTSTLVHPELQHEADADSAGGSAVPSEYLDAMEESDPGAMVLLPGRPHLHSPPVVTVISGEEHFEDYGEGSEGRLFPEAPCSGEEGSSGPALLTPSHRGQGMKSGGGHRSLHGEVFYSRVCPISCPGCAAPRGIPGSQQTLASPEPTSRLSSSDLLAAKLHSIFTDEAFEFYCTQCHKQINRLEDLSARLSDLEMNSPTKQLSSKKVARHLHQSGALTMEALEDLPPEPVEGTEEAIADKVVFLEKRVSELEKDSAANGEQHSRLRQENLQLVHRANALEEQLKEQELRTCELVLEEARKQRELLCRMEREKSIEIENLQARLQQLDEENGELRSCAPCLKASIERLEEEKQKLLDEIEDLTLRLSEEQEDRRRMGDRLSHERHQFQRDKESTQEVIEDLRKQLEHLQLLKLEAEQRRGRSSSAGLQEYNSRTRESELEQEVRRLKQDNQSLKEQNDELNGQIINLSIQGAKNLFSTSFSESLAAEISSVSRDELMEAIQKQEEINFRLQDYIDRIIVAIMETNPSILEVK
ncbi:rab11 family-interacting protein 3 isoform X2 [Loxodonta africana]|uniref:rab11 family-interacting protein 3 isoform X2 n=1 Tax=Loxodonta africana TaxID=9785 RepID=UPI0030D289D7